jgi:hypothetical protein
MSLDSKKIVQEPFQICFEFLIDIKRPKNMIRNVNFAGVPGPGMLWMDTIILLDLTYPLVVRMTKRSSEILF